MGFLSTNNLIRPLLSERKSIRKSTAVKSAETLRRITERTTSKRKLKRKRKHFHMTQEQRLQEAKFTEIENLKSLRKCVTILYHAFYLGRWIPSRDCNVWTEYLLPSLHFLV